LAQCQFKVTECLSVALYFGVLAIKTGFESGPLTADLTTTVVHSYKSLINDVKPVHSLNLI